MSSVLAPLGNQAPIFNGTAPGANTNIFTANLTPKKGYRKLIIDIQLATASVVNLMVKKSATTITSPLNSGVALLAGKPYVFEKLVHSDHSYNLQLETDGVITILQLAIQGND